MRIFDYHTHSVYSFDAKRDAEIANMAAAADRLGIAEIALCDHYDLNFVLSGENPDIDFAERQNHIDKANAGSAVHILSGVELGQATQEREAAEALLARFPFDIVLGSLHSIRGEPDFYFMDFNEIKPSRAKELYEAYVTELCELAQWGRFHVMAHVTYPLRYMSKYDKVIDIRPYDHLYEKLFSILIERDIALEINTSGYRSKLRDTLPGMRLAQMYIKCGGKLICVGSDAHTPSALALRFSDTYATLRSLGLEGIAVMREGIMTQVPFSLLEG
ncbi:MAG: histidinol-phosphatase HisJ family protein [Eubacteriales bacterium]